MKNELREVLGPMRADIDTMRDVYLTREQRAAFDRIVAAALSAEPDSDGDLRADAERYRWLRNPANDVAKVIDKVVGETPMSEDGRTGGYLHYEYRAGEELDAAIDAARSAAQEK